MEITNFIELETRMLKLQAFSAHRMTSAAPPTLRLRTVSLCAYAQSR
jgi:hypothetical protein